MLFSWYAWKFRILLPLFFFFAFFFRVAHWTLKSSSHTHQKFKVPVAYRGIILLSIASFSSAHFRMIKKIFLINFFGLQQKNFCLLSCLIQLKQAMMLEKLWLKIEHIVVSRDAYQQKMESCWEQSTHIIW